MPLPLTDGPDPAGLAEFSVVYTDRALNHMSVKFQQVMRFLSQAFKDAYNGDQVALVPGGGSYAMEAVARQFVGKDQPVMVLRNGWFSYRWTQILDKCWLYEAEIAKARPVAADAGQLEAAFEPAPIQEVVAKIQALKPAVVFAPMVETSAGMLLPREYITQVGAAVKAAGGLFVLDCIAAGCDFVDMQACNVDCLISAPQKGWSGPAGAGIVVLGQRGVAALEHTEADSFVLDLKQWVTVMRAYEKGGHMYHATMPTDALAKTADVLREMQEIGLPTLCEKQYELGRRVRELVASKGLKSLAAPGFAAPGVVVVYTTDAEIAAKFVRAGVQIAAGVPLMCDHESNAQSAKFRTFRFGLFGLDKLMDIDRAVRVLDVALDKVLDAPAFASAL